VPARHSRATSILHGWTIDGQEIVVGELRIGAGARIGTRSLLMPGASVGDGAEIEPGSLVRGEVPAGQRWAGSPAVCVGAAGDGWPEPRLPVSGAHPGIRVLYALGLAAPSALALLASLPGILLVAALSPASVSAASLAGAILPLAPLIALSFVVTYALLVALTVRAASPAIQPGWHRDNGLTGWALWFTEAVLGGARGILFPLYASVYTRPWLRLLGVRVGSRTEVSTAVGLNRLTSFGERAFATDDVVLTCSKARGGWLFVAPIEIGDRTFLGNSAIVGPASTIGDGCLVGALTVAPPIAVDGTSWFGCPALQLPRAAPHLDPGRTTHPPRRLIMARSATELVRILLPSSIAVALGAIVFSGLAALGTAAGTLAMVLAAPFAIAGAGLGAAAITIAVKWTLIGRYRAGVHPLWSSFVWRDEIVNTCQEQLAGAWLLRHALATPLISLYLRLMGATVGEDVWCESLNLTEFDIVTLEAGSAINRSAVVETHLFHDRLLQIGAAVIENGATVGPASAVLPDTRLGAGCSVGGRSVVMRGESLPAGTRWLGAPVGPA
jgi:non-ribosomal peptide synthetase-like protein